MRAYLILFDLYQIHICGEHYLLCVKSFILFKRFLAFLFRMFVFGDVRHSHVILIRTIIDYKINSS